MKEKHSIKYRLLKKIVVLLLLSSIYNVTMLASEADLSLITTRIQSNYKNANITSNDNSTTSNLQLLQLDGSFSDINYADRSQTNWQPQTHLDRLKPMVISYSSSASKYFADTNLYNNIVNALQYWYDSHPSSTNWYMQEIAVPQRTGLILLAMRTASKQLPATLENNLITRMVDEGGDPALQTGANKMDIATHWIYRGCLTKDESVLGKGVEEVYDPLQLVTDESIQPDYSYHQHGSQLYIGGYGRVLINGVSSLAIFMEGTSYALSGEKLDILSRFVRETYIPSIRGKYLLFNISGRSIARSNSLIETSFVSILNRMKTIDPQYSDFYNKTIARINGSQSAGYDLSDQNTHYWRSDYTRHQRKAYTIDLRMASVFTARNENGNGENLKGYFLVDGATSITQRGDEYVDIFPVWDWSRIPGTTTPERTTIPKTAAWAIQGTSFFAGGVSDGKYGVSAYFYDDKDFNVNTKAKKSWFFFDDEIVCLGAGINSTATEDVSTTINQTLLNGNVTVVSSDNVQSTLNKGEHSFNDLSWILHDGIGYYFPSSSQLSVSNQSQQGSWYSINTTQSQTEVSKNVFKAWLKHGNQPKNATYSYFIVPNKNSVSDLNLYNPQNIEILANTDSMQVLKHNGLGILGLVFFKEATFSGGDFYVHADNPCTVLLKNIDSNQVEAFVSDPSRRTETLSLIMQLPQIEGRKLIKCELPVYPNPYAGSTLRYEVNDNTPPYHSNEYARLYPEADAYVRNGFYSTTNYGSDKVLVVKKDGDNYEREAYIKFNLKDIDLDDLQSKGELKVYLSAFVASAGKDIHSTQWNINYVHDSQWDEKEITWDNRPYSDYLIHTIPGSGSNSKIKVDVTDCIITDAYPNNKQVTFHIAGTATGSATDASFHSSRSGITTSPYLLFEVNSTVGIQDKKDNNSHSLVKVYPTVLKTGDVITIESASQSIDSNDYDIKVFNLHGHEILSGQGNYLNTDILSSGVYIIFVIDKQNNINHYQRILVY